MHEHEILSALAALYDAGSGDGSLAPNPRLAWQFQLLAKSSVPWMAVVALIEVVPPPPLKKRGAVKKMKPWMIEDMLYYKKTSKVWSKLLFPLVHVQVPCLVLLEVYECSMMSKPQM